LKYLSIENILALHRRVIEKYGHEKGLLDIKKLEACVEKPREIFFGSESHPTIESKAAVYLYYITTYHPFIDGNKRTAFYSMCVFLAQNGFYLIINEDECVNFVISVASGNETMDTVMEWVKTNIIPLEIK
jgi:death-on-curing protein